MAAIVMVSLAHLITLSLVLISCFSSALSLTTANNTQPRNYSIAKPNCNERCGNVSIPFPFGMTEECFLNPQFFVKCNDSIQPPQLFLKNSTIEITKVSLSGQLNILKFISRDCYRDGKRTDRSNPVMELSSLTVNHTANKFIAVGCDTYAVVRGYYVDDDSVGNSYMTGCMSLCNSVGDVVDGKCSGVGCCQTSIPKGAWNVNITLSSYFNYTHVANSTNNCSYAFVVEEDAFNFSTNNLRSLQSTEKLPLVLDWVIGNETCQVAKGNSSTYACNGNNTDCYDNNLHGYRCICKQGYDGNPYLENGCQDIDECADGKHKCAEEAICTNTAGNYKCTCPPNFSGDGTKCVRDYPMRKAKNNLIAIGVTAGVAFLLIVSGWSYVGLQRRKMLMMREKFFEENGGLILQQRLIGQEGSSHTLKIFTTEELKRATNDFDRDKILGQGGFGTVYKGYLDDNTVIAIKKSKVINRYQTDQFINEVIVLSQINHRNVVKVLGCCLDTEVPSLVYEFIDNGTLFEHLHDKVKSCVLSLDIRLRIAAETAGVLSYLHSIASPPIIHRDIKSVNILLDKNYTAKVSDFGASRLVPVDQTELSTMVQGTLGYLDPEYLQTSQLTEKSDVYSFGVVLVELLTGKKALSFDKPEEERSVAQYFLSSLEKGHLIEVVDDNLVSDESTWQLIKEVAILAKRCLNVKGVERPTMKEVASELEGSRLTTKQKHSWVQSDQNSEEAESLLQVNQLAFEYGYGDHSVNIDSISSHLTLPVPGGR